MAKNVRVSLANKCQLLFGAAVLLILCAALGVGWLRMRTLVREGQLETARKLAIAYLQGQLELGSAGELPPRKLGSPAALRREVLIVLVPPADFDLAKQRDSFAALVIDRFVRDRHKTELTDQARDEQGRQFFQYARAVYTSDLARFTDPVQVQKHADTQADPDAELSQASSQPPPATDPLAYVLLLRLRSDQAARQLMLNRIYIIAAGLLAGLLAIGVFWFITTRLILSPVRLLRAYAAKVSEGDLQTRSDINTGDEFEQLSDMFNTMLDSLKSSQDELRKINKSLDLKLGELAQTNVALFESNKVKGEFLANVSHELRTPLNSIVGFAEVLEETLAESAGPSDEKRQRYCQNIITSSRQLLELINDLLDLAKIEAGRMDLRLASVSVADLCEGLVGIMRPQAVKRGVELKLVVEPNLPLIQTDPSRLQQVLFNFLSNAIKFSPEGQAVTLSAALDRAAGPGGAFTQRVRISVADHGPGIAQADQDRIFDKFTQLDPSVTKAHGGTGLGLTIARDLARLLQARITLDSSPGAGATFSILLPLDLKPPTAPLMPEAPADAGP
jgi:signal transduction histidine kinase